MRNAELKNENTSGMLSNWWMIDHSWKAWRHDGLKVGSWEVVKEGRVEGERSKEKG